jgi:hypothetical protein
MWQANMCGDPASRAARARIHPEHRRIMLVPNSSSLSTAAPYRAVPSSARWRRRCNLSGRRSMARTVEMMSYSDIGRAGDLFSVLSWRLDRL